MGDSEDLAVGVTAFLLGFGMFNNANIFHIMIIWYICSQIT